jgi:hypothetical protein
MRRITAHRGWRAGLAVALAGALAVAAPAAAGTGGSHNGFPELQGPRGLDVSPKGELVVAQSTGEYGVIKDSWRHGKKSKKKSTKRFVKLGQVPPGFLAPALDMNRRGELFILTTEGEPGSKGAATLYRWTKWTGQKAVADIAAYQAKDVDPYDLEGEPGHSNPYGVAALDDGSALVADAGGNDLLRVLPNGKIYTVARVKPREIPVPAGLPPMPPDAPQLPAVGTPIPSEAVVTSVTVGKDGYWYIGELRGFPGNPGYSQIWRVHPKAKNAVCDPKQPKKRTKKGWCTLYADGFTSIVALDSDKRGALYVAELSKRGWLAAESFQEDPSAGVGSVYKLWHGKKQELGAGEVILPGDIAVSDKGGYKYGHKGKHKGYKHTYKSKKGEVYVTTPIFGPGTIKLIR